jgi:hypothetical protein
VVRNRAPRRYNKMVGRGRRARPTGWYGNGTKAMKETNSLTCFLRINYPVRFVADGKY